MTCDNQGIVGIISNISAPAIVKGSDAFIETQLVYKGTQDSAKIDTFVGATGFFGNDDGTVQSVPATLVSADKGVLNIALAASGTSLLKAGEELNFEVSIEDASGLRFVQFEAALTVAERFF